MKRPWLLLTIVATIVGCSSVRPPASPPADSPGPDQPTSAEVSALRAQVQQLQQRLDQLEPPAPIRVDTPPIAPQIEALLAPERVRDVLANGKELPFGLVGTSTTWQPPQYWPSWHSTSYNRFASVQTIAEFARHRFHVQTIFQGSLATADESLIGLSSADLQIQPCGQTPAYPCGTPDQSDGSMRVYALKAHVQSIHQRGPLLVFTVQPLLAGCEIIWLDKSVLGPALGDQPGVWAAFATGDGEVWEVMPVR